MSHIWWRLARGAFSILLVFCLWKALCREAQQALSFYALRVLVKKKGFLKKKIVYFYMSKSLVLSPFYSVLVLEEGKFWQCFQFLACCKLLLVGSILTQDDDDDDGVCNPVLLTWKEAKHH